MKTILNLLCCCIFMLFVGTINAQTTAQTTCQKVASKSTACKPADCKPTDCKPADFASVEACLEWCKKNCADLSKCDPAECASVAKKESKVASVFQVVSFGQGNPSCSSSKSKAKASVKNDKTIKKAETSKAVKVASIQKP